ncbi:MAG: hypothetical protein P1P84_09185 [Deferrisomatales bacterium]|nr:hypothetical protein [Deferrisomatales bacterium]
MTDRPAVIPLARQLCQLWEEMLDADALGEEAEYRVGKLLDRAEPIQGKAFLQTVKGQEMTGQCLEMTRSLRGPLQRGGEVPWAGLTDLEVLFEELLKMAYAFRVRTG